jgi:hypothetical protein
MLEVSARRKKVWRRGEVLVMPERMMNQRRTREPARRRSAAGARLVAVEG